jgi:cobalamin biosynthetic protein CobC
MDTREERRKTVHDLWHHGGNINAARHLFPDAPSPWIDLSTGINPLSYPVGAIAPSSWRRLPEAWELAALESLAACAYGADLRTGIVAAPGSQALIQWLPRLFPARRVAIMGLTYGEHEICWRAAGAEVTTVEGLADLLAADVGIVVNPNNPDGRVVSPGLLAGAAKSLARRGGLLIVDEAFIDLLGKEASVAPFLPECGALVLRSFGKAYGLAGLRLGFALAPPDLGARLREALGPWAVSGPAIEIAGRALADGAWLARARIRLGKDADRLDELLGRAGLDVVGGAPLFRLARHADAWTRFESLCAAGILTRPFRRRPDWLRFGIPAAPADWERLEAALLAGA